VSRPSEKPLPLPWDGRGVIIAFAVCLAAALLPVLAVETPPLADYLDHLGRMHAIASLDRDPLLARFYTIEWRLLPNLAMDLAVPPLARLIGIYAAGRVFILATLALMATGPFAVHWALHRRLDAFPMAGFLLLYSFAFLQGLMNYLMGIGLAAWAVAAWIALERRPAWLRGLVSAVFVAALFFCHLYAVGLYGFVLLCHLARRRHWTLADLAAFALPFVPPALMLLLSPTTGLAGETVFSLEDKDEGIKWLYWAYYENGLDVLWGLAVLAVLAWALWRRGVCAHPTGKVLVAAAPLLYLAMPQWLLGAWGADVRLPVGLGIVAAGFFSTGFRGRRERIAFLAAITLLAVARFAGAAVAWHSLDADLHDFRRSLAAIEPGSRILVAEADQPTGSLAFNRPLSHASCLAMIERSSFVADAFTQPGKQILAVRPEYLAMSNAQDGEEPALSELVRAMSHPDPALDEYWAAWWRRFDYVYVLYTGEDDPEVPPPLRQSYRGARFRLYRVAPSP